MPSCIICNAPITEEEKPLCRKCRVDIMRLYIAFWTVLNRDLTVEDAVESFHRQYRKRGSPY